MKRSRVSGATPAPRRRASASSPAMSSPGGCRSDSRVSGSGLYGSSLLEQGTLEGIALTEPDPVDIADDDSIRLPEPRLGVPHVVLFAEIADDPRCLAEVRSGHRREQVMLDLIVE